MLPLPLIREFWLTEEYRWNEPAGRYIASSGQFVAFSAVQASLEEVLLGSQAEMDLLADRLQYGGIRVEEWRSMMIEQVKTVQVASAALGRGGWAQMSQADWGWVGRECRRQYAYLNRFADQIASGEQPLDGRFLTRAKMYGLAGRGTFEEMRRRYGKMYKGVVEERRRLTLGAEHCMTVGNKTGCLELAELDWQPVGTLPRIGFSPCIVNCRCYFEMRDAENNLIGMSI